MKSRIAAFLALAGAFLLLRPAGFLAAQEFGFLAEDGEAADGAAAGVAFGPILSGRLSASFLAFPIDAALDTSLDNFDSGISGMLGVSAAGSRVESFLRLRLDPKRLAANPASILDEARIRFFAGDITLDTGLLKVTWGRADSLSVLDVVNARDRTDISVRDDLDLKIAAPMLRASWAAAPRIGLEALFLPLLRHERLAESGDWTPKMFLVAAKNLPSGTALFRWPDTERLDYWQAGARLATGAGPVDFAFQYFYGFLPTPMFHIQPSAILTNASTIPVSWTRFHQVGADMAAEIAGFNVRLEAGANLTGDIDGTDASVFNPAIVWAAGFDRPLPAGIDLNLQAKGSVRLFDAAARAAGGIESAMDATDTQFALRLAKEFSRGAATAELVGAMGLERRDFMVSPGLVMKAGDAELALRACAFIPTDLSNPGNLGQYGDRGYVQFAVSHQF